MVTLPHMQLWKLPIEARCSLEVVLARVYCLSAELGLLVPCRPEDLSTQLVR